MRSDDPLQAGRIRSLRGSDRRDERPERERRAGLDPADIESLERSTVEGVAPARVVEVAGWLVPLDGGAIGRAKSAVPLRHDLDASAVADIEAAYAAAGLPPMFRIAEAPGLEPVRHALAARGFVGGKPTVVKVGDVARLAAIHDAPAELMRQPDEAWGAVFLGEGFDPQDGAGRVAALSRAPDALYAAVRDAGRTVAVGAVTFGHGWGGVHGMRTEARLRGRGLASQVLAALGRACEARRVDRVFLQVEEGNPARSLYRKAGFKAAWTYLYWRREPWTPSVFG